MSNPRSDPKVSKEDRWGTDLDCGYANHWEKLCLASFQSSAQTMDTDGLSALLCLGQDMSIFPGFSTTGKPFRPVPGN